MKKTFYPPFEISWYVLLQTKYYVNNFITVFIAGSN